MMDKTKGAFWITGSNGMLGKEIGSLLKELDIPFYSTGRDCDITDEASLKSFASGKNIGCIINCAAYTKVDKAEEEPGKAYAINSLGPGSLARLAERNGMQMVHISTDYVFDGTVREGYLENHQGNPLSVYGRTKLEGEYQVRKWMQDYYIIRTSWLYGIHGKNFLLKMLEIMNERDVIQVVDDQHGSPTYACDLARFILFLLDSGKPHGIYHFTNEGETTWHGFACRIYHEGKISGILDRECDIRPVSSDKYESKAKRPKFSRLLQSKALDYPRNRSWEESLRLCIDKLKTMKFNL
jgi:dTDP-4-dehydrorhamnose reductase